MTFFRSSLKAKHPIQSLVLTLLIPCWGGCDVIDELEIGHLNSGGHPLTDSTPIHDEMGGATSTTSSPSVGGTVGAGNGSNAGGTVGAGNGSNAGGTVGAGNASNAGGTVGAGNGSNAGGTAEVDSTVPGTTCEHNGVTYIVGDSYSEGCTSCLCMGDGTWGRCTGGCIATYCEHNGTQYAIGQSYSDGCTSCLCMIDGTWGRCTGGC
jgi:hypothetical protein